MNPSPLQDLSLRYLLKMYDLSDRGLQPEVDGRLLQSELGYTHAQMRSAYDYLLSKGWVNNKCRVPCILITIPGIEEVGRIMENQREQVLEKLYKLAHGHIEFISVSDIAESLGLSFDVAYDYLRYWEERDLVEMSHDVDREYETVKFTKLGLKAIEQPNNPDTPHGRHLNVTYNLTLNDNQGNINMGGHGNTQSVNIKNNSFDEAAKKLLDLIEQSDMSPINKITIKGNVQTLIQLNELEKTPEVKEAAKSSWSIVDKGISLSADLYTLAVPLIPYLLAPFQ
jgi:predicted transcriptional regulator